MALTLSAIAASPSTPLSSAVSEARSELRPYTAGARRADRRRNYDSPDARLPSTTRPAAQHALTTSRAHDGRPSTAGAPPLTSTDTQLGQAQITVPPLVFEKRGREAFGEPSRPGAIPNASAAKSLSAGQPSGSARGAQRHARHERHEPILRLTDSRADARYGPTASSHLPWGAPGSTRAGLRQGLKSTVPYAFELVDRTREQQGAAHLGRANTAPVMMAVSRPHSAPALGAMPLAPMPAHGRPSAGMQVPSVQVVQQPPSMEHACGQARASSAGGMLAASSTRASGLGTTLPPSSRASAASSAGPFFAGMSVPEGAPTVTLDEQLAAEDSDYRASDAATPVSRRRSVRASRSPSPPGRLSVVGIAEGAGGATPAGSPSPTRRQQRGRSRGRESRFSVSDVRAAVAIMPRQQPALPEGWGETPRARLASLRGAEPALGALGEHEGETPAGSSSHSSAERASHRAHELSRGWRRLRALFHSKRLRRALVHALAAEAVDVQRYVHACALFESCTEDELDSICAFARAKVADRYTTLYRQGTSAHGSPLYLVVEGTVRLVGYDDTVRHVHAPRGLGLLPGRSRAYVGVEGAASDAQVSDRRRAETASCLEPLVVICVPSEQLPHSVREAARITANVRLLDPDVPNSLSVFRDLPDAKLRAIASLFRFVAVPANVTIVRQGNTDGNLYTLACGSVEAVVEIMPPPDAGRMGRRSSQRRSIRKSVRRMSDGGATLTEPPPKPTRLVVGGMQTHSPYKHFGEGGLLSWLRNGSLKFDPRKAHIVSAEPSWCARGARRADSAAAFAEGSMATGLAAAAAGRAGLGARGSSRGRRAASDRCAHRAPPAAAAAPSCLPACMCPVPRPARAPRSCCPLPAAAAAAAANGCRRPQVSRPAALPFRFSLRAAAGDRRAIRDGAEDAAGDQRAQVQAAGRAQAALRHAPYAD